MRARRLRGTVVAFAAIALSSLSAAPADAAVVDAACESQGSMAFSPGLTLTAKPTAWTGSGTFGPCVSSQVSSATFTASGDGSLSCLGGQVQGTFIINWVMTGGGSARSVVQLTVVPATGPTGALSLALEGTVTEGLFLGDSYRSVFASVGMNYLACLSRAGVQSALGAGLSTWLGGL